ncbi:pentapeptide repeat-containing protein [Paenibacillus sp. ClWae2A]|uniref:pentapeptide repeat-containing protein n=1 Tax=Paenibacillus TaxID=44249 RepID=UPI00105A0B06|nr:MULTISPECIES: pentapeptide repeat-containing protein [Paenibacillus]MDT9719655.1 pentapeptide repeat-containing protein [Paenibacillus sp. ClWae2A]TDL70022.1 pentapeptide repeat-containing protein [Paenibacillus amylolyticus]
MEEKDIINMFDLHKKWVETIGDEGEQLKLDEVDLRVFDLSDVLLEQSYLIDCTFDDLKLENIDFHSSLLASSTFINTCLDKCDFYKSDLRYTDFSNCIIKNSRFSKGDCWEAAFNNACLVDCNLINVSFHLTDFRNARLENIDISVSTFKDTLLNGVTLKGIKGIEEAFFQSINIGTPEKPLLLEKEEARRWFLEKCES